MLSTVLCRRLVTAAHPELAQTTAGGIFLLLTTALYGGCDARAPPYDNLVSNTRYRNSDP